MYTDIYARWEETMGGSLLRFVPKGGCRVSTHIAAFDMDNTLIKSKSGKVGRWVLQVVPIHGYCALAPIASNTWILSDTSYRSVE